MGNDSRIDVGVNNHFFRQTWPRCGQRQLSVQHKVDAPYITVIKTVVVVVGLSCRHDGSPDHEVVVWVRRCEKSPILDVHTRLQMSHVKPWSGGG